MTHRWFVLVLGIVSLAWAGLPAWSATLYVSPQGLSVAPYASWSNAANTVHAAMGVAADFDTILLDDGEYALTNQVVVTSAITIRSKNGPAYTTIDGNNYAGKPVTNRCFWVSNSLAVLSGLTVTNGAALRSDWNGQGGGVFLVSGTVTNCVVARNLALGQGGGIAISNANLAGAGWVRNSLIQSNTAAEGGGVCAFANAQVDHCFITGNRATTNGGGVQMAMGGLLVNCVINGNSATNANALGGGVYADRIGLNTGAIYSCTIAGNAAAMGGGVTLNNNTNLSISNLSVYNSIIYNNTATNNVDRYELSQTNGTVLDGSNYWSCCVTTNAVGAPATHRWNFTNAPIWVSVASNDFRLQSHSPCMGAGTNQDWMTTGADMAGLPRILVQTNVDVGAYEYYPLVSRFAAPAAMTVTVVQGRSVVSNASLWNDTPDRVPLSVSIRQSAAWIGVGSLTNRTLTNSVAHVLTLTNSALSVAPGQYTGQVTITATNALSSDYGSVTNIIDLTMNVMSAAVSRISLENTAILGVAAPTQSVELVSSGSGQLPFTVVHALPWLSVSPASGILTNAGTDTLAINYSYASLVPGRYTGSFDVVIAEGGGWTQSVAVAFNVMSVSVVPTHIQHSVLAGTLASNQPVTVTVAGNGQMAWAATSTPSWVSVSPAAWGVTNGSTVGVAVACAASALPEGMNTGVVLLTSSEGGGITQSVPVSVLVLPRPSLAVTTNQWVSNLPKGALPTPRSLGIWNSGGTPQAPMNWTLQASAAWLSASAWQGTTPADDTNTITMSFSSEVEGFSEGVYTGLYTLLARDSGTNYSPGGQVLMTQTVVVSVTTWAPGKPHDVSASDGTVVNAVRVTWTPVTDAQGVTNAATYQVWRDVAASMTTAVLLVSTTNSFFDDASASAGQVYYYSVRSVNAYGKLGDMSASDLGYWGSLAAPVDVFATDGVYTDKARISWRSVVGATGYAVWRRLTTSSEVGICLGSTASTFLDDGTAAPGVFYYFWVTATNILGSSPVSSLDIGSRACLPPATVSASDGESTASIAVTWSASAGADSYEVWRATVEDAAAAVKLTQLNALSYTDAAVSAGVKYYYWVKSRWGTGMSGFSNPDAGWLGLSVTLSVNASDGAYVNKVVVQWTVAPEAVRYEVWRSSGVGFPGAVLLVDTTGSSFDDTSAVAGLAYYYWVKAKSSTGIGWLSAWDRGFRQLGVPTGVSATRGTDINRIRVTWNAVDGASTYEIWRSISSDLFSAALWAETVYPWFDDSATTPMRTYYYWIKAKSPLGSGSFSASDSGWRGRTPSPYNTAATHDYDGDGKSDVAVCHSASGSWYMSQSLIGFATIGFNMSGVIPLSADFDGDGKADPAIYQSGSGLWFALLSASGTQASIVFGGSGYTPVPADYDGDGKMDPALYQASSGIWVALLSSRSYAPVSIPFGGQGFLPVPADYDGDGRTDPTVFHSATGFWYTWYSITGAVESQYLGSSAYLPLTGDYDGDRKADKAVYAPGIALWLLVYSSDGSAAQIPFGLPGALPVSGDYDGDGNSDLAVYASGYWAVLFSSLNNAASLQFGAADFLPTP